jgi:hypothetical protein
VKIDLLNVAFIGTVLVLTACSEAPQPAASGTKTESETKKAAEPLGPVSAKTAYWEMYKLAHAWVADVAPLSMVSKQVPGIKNGDGKAGMWSVTFVSPSLRQARNLSYSVVAVPPNIGKGVDVGRPGPWAPARDAMPFQTSEFAIDSDAAYKTAFPRAQGWVKDHPDKEAAAFTLGYNTVRFNSPVWYLQWGTPKLGYAAFVNATTGTPVTAK